MPTAADNRVLEIKHPSPEVSGLLKHSNRYPIKVTAKLARI